MWGGWPREISQQMWLASEQEGWDGLPGLWRRFVEEAEGPEGKALVPMLDIKPGDLGDFKPDFWPPGDKGPGDVSPPGGRTPPTRLPCDQAQAAYDAALSEADTAKNVMFTECANEEPVVLTTGEVLFVNSRACNTAIKRADDAARALRSAEINLKNCIPNSGP